MDADTFDGMATGAAASDTPSRPIDNDSQTMDDTHASESPQWSKNESAQSLPGKEVDHTMTPQAETSLHLFLGELDSESETEAKLAELSAILEASPEDIDTRSLEPPHKTPLQIAIGKDVFQTFNLLIKAGADVNALDGENTHSFYHALEYGDSAYLKVLLERVGQTEHPTSSGRCFLHLWGFYNQEESIMRRLFEFQRHFLNEQSLPLLQTPLNYTVSRENKKGVAFLLEKGPNLGIVDRDGRSPLMTALKENTSEIFDILVNHLFEPGRELAAKDVITRNNVGRSIFVEFCKLRRSENEAWEASFAKLLDNILDKFPHLDFNTTPVYEGLLDIAIFSTKHSESKIMGEFALRVVGWVPNRLLFQRFQKDATLMDEILCWLACRKERHNVAVTILKELTAQDQTAYIEQKGWTLAHWAIYHRLPSVLLQCPPLTAGEKSRGQEIISHLKTSSKTKEPQPFARDSAKEVKQDNQTTRNEQGRTETQDRVLDAMRDILDFIGLETTIRAKEPLRITKPINGGIKDCLNGFQASIVEVRQNKNEFSMGTRFRGIYNTIYDEKESFTTIRDAIEQFQKSTKKWAPRTRVSGISTWKLARSTQVRERHHVGPSSSSQYNDTYSPGTGKNGGLASAFYMPFILTDYKRHETNNNRRDFQDILNGYYQSRGSVIHDAPTLDEHYYRFAADEESQRDRGHRNKNQVFTKYQQENKTGEPLGLIRISQLWAWTIEDGNIEWLITSASCAEIDNERTITFINSIVDHLRTQVEDGSRERGPNSAAELSKSIAEYCVGTYDRQQEVQKSKSDKKNGNQQNLARHVTKDNVSTDISGSTTRHEAETSEISIRQTFSNFINRIGRQEADLYGQFSGYTRTLRQEEGTSSSHGNPLTTEEAVKKAAQLLFEIKDVRHELNILRTVAEFQRKVQSRMDGREPDAISTMLDADLTAAYVRNDIDEMDKLAGRIRDALHTTITLHESEISLDQGKRVMMFTVITAWFLPASFLTSLFALDVSSFLQAPLWSLLVTLLVPCLVLGLAGGYMYYGRHIKNVASKLPHSWETTPKDVSHSQRKETGNLTVGSTSAANTRRNGLWRSLPGVRHRGSRGRENGVETQV
ncbi:hypothetical protein CPAR01_13179 [Colletotrichum paranaense]|uniref:Ankyrin repeat protein n=1 Tax=Colletotrichum paranaense TaxID=1914294 RepID=A0ABQ9S5D7_9PEZI|nr:uncharacterized protein CPAR01_13179 [Colletotrichum paranaense]KAK1526651.1 hypothetical protein CPAR01_13179 [Colletotrichum paranaense]